MSKNDEITPGRDESEEERWRAFQREFERANGPLEQPAPAPPKRVWSRNLALALLAGSLAFAALKLTSAASEDGPTATAAANTTPGATPSLAAPAAPAATAAARPMVPLAEVFPEQVPDGAGGSFTRVGSAVMPSCTERDSVGPRLAALIESGRGCVGEQIALYKDARNNQYNLAVFTMKDPQDALRAVTELTMAFNDYQVGTQAPPRGSGLATLAPETGMVQSFAGYGRVMVVSLGQWSDGRTGDFQKLVDGMQPLQKGVTDRVTRYEGNH
ncbi:hypothetical protein [Streptomyces sp. NPDC047976]|uniref:hypothetical protein n=1 Tax=Streptomyces sp. NPDC047976 TaxID=3155746 RepID=UPI00341F4939